MIAALAVAVIVLAIVFFSGSGGHKYTLVFQNAGQLVPDNQVLIGGSPVGSVESIELSDDNLAEVHVEVEQELHEGTTAVIRATSLSGVANHYVSISPGPNSNPALGEGAELGLGSTTTPIDIDQFFNTFPPSVRKGLSNFIKGNAAIYAGQGPAANDAYKYFGPALNRTDAFVKELNADQRLLRTLHRQLQQALDDRRRARRSSSPARSPTPTPPSARSPPRTSPSTSPCGAAAGDAPGQHDLRQPPRRPRRPRTADRHGEAGDQEPGAVPGRTAPGALQIRALHPQPAAHRRPARQGERRRPNCWRCCRPCSEQASKAFPHAEDAIAAFQPNLNFARAYTPDIFNALGKLGAVAGYYDGNGHYVRAATAAQNLFAYEGGSLEPITKAQQFDAFGASAPVHRRCPGGATQSAADGSNPFVDPPSSGSSVNSSECNPADVPPGP